MATGQGDSVSRTGEAGDGELLERFRLRRDEASFAALVRRHGPMVLGVCSRVLGNAHDAEDAFQVTFLVLARKAGSLARPDLLANWLYGVAYRTARKARGRALRQGEHERQVMARARPDPQEPARELREVLDEELNRLPEKYRAPLVLCYLEGKTNEEAARQLGWPAGSMSARLARGRGLLRARLTRRGLAFDLRFCSRFLAQYELPTPPVSAGLEAATVRAAVRFGGGQEPAGDIVPAKLAELAGDVLRSLPGRRPCWLRVLGFRSE